MGCGCEYEVYVAGADRIEEDIKLVAGAGAGYIGAAYLETMLTVEKDGTAKEGTLAENSDYRNALYLGAGAAAIYYMGDEPMVKGAGTGVIVFGLKQLINSKSETYKIQGRRRNGKPKYIDGWRYDQFDQAIDLNKGRATQQQRVDLNAQKETEKIVIEYP